MDKTFFDSAGALPDACFTRPPDLTIVLGSGWGDALQSDRMLVCIPYSDIPGLGAATVVGHAGELRLYERSGKRVLAFCGRIFSLLCGRKRKSWSGNHVRRAWIS